MPPLSNEASINYSFCFTNDKGIREWKQKEKEFEEINSKRI